MRTPRINGKNVSMIAMGVIWDMMMMVVENMCFTLLFYHKVVSSDWLSECLRVDSFQPMDSHLLDTVTPATANKFAKRNIAAAAATARAGGGGTAAAAAVGGTKPTSSS